MPASVDILGLSCRHAHPCSSPDILNKSHSTLARCHATLHAALSQHAAPPKQRLHQICLPKQASPMSLNKVHVRVMVRGLEAGAMLADSQSRRAPRGSGRTW